MISVTGLECYVCDNQDDNVSKCLKTIKTCEHHHDRCLSIVRWSTTPYWSQVRFVHEGLLRLPKPQTLYPCLRTWTEMSILEIITSMVTQATTYQVSNEKYRNCLSTDIPQFTASQMVWKHQPFKVKHFLEMIKIARN